MGVTAGWISWVKNNKYTNNDPDFLIQASKDVCINDQHSQDELELGKENPWCYFLIRRGQGILVDTKVQS